VQSAFARVFDTASRNGRPREPLPWLKRVLSHLVADQLRERRTRERAASLATGEETTAGLDALRCRCVVPAVRTLRPDQRQRLELHLAGRRPNDVAGELRLTPNAAAVRVHRARRALRTAVEQRCGACAADLCEVCGCKGSGTPE